MKWSVATGHNLTSRAALDMFKAGGNAFDAVVAAGFASVVTEPTLTSLGGGGFLLAHIAKEKKDILFDFFVNTPGLENGSNITPVMTPVEINFPGCTQVFHIGFGSVAVPGMLKGLMHLHERLCTLPIKTILAPSMHNLENGVEISELQGYFLSLLEPIFLSTEYGQEIYTKNGRYVRQRDRIFNPLLKTFYKDIINENCDIYSGEIAERFIDEVKSQHGVIAQSDLDAYEVYEREPLLIKYRDREILTNPYPSSGGIKLALGLHLLENIKMSSIPHGSEEFIIILAELMREMNAFNPFKNDSRAEYPFSDSTLSPLIKSFIENISGKTLISNQGTTQISVIDEEGNAASMTTSNGSGSGCFIPGTGIMLNNMMGEDDLHPDGFFTSSPNKRVSSMMVPTITIRDGEVETVLGSGGSKRIRNAIFQVLINIIDYDYSLEKAVESSRIHIEENILHAEPGMNPEIIDRLKKQYRVNIWKKKDVYFGGVHCVNNITDGWGDSRRGGSFLTGK
jgi:gamma-glutamyltranspeptidase/glutathione hydrolase